MLKKLAILFCILCLVNTVYFVIIVTVDQEVNVYMRGLGDHFALFITFTVVMAVFSTVMFFVVQDMSILGKVFWKSKVDTFLLMCLSSTALAASAGWLLISWLWKILDVVPLGWVFGIFVCASSLFLFFITLCFAYLFLEALNQVKGIS